MVVVGLTGGIGSGKSTVARMLRDLGAVIVDADLIARQVVAPGTPGYRSIVEFFGRRVVRDDGALDRAVLAGLVFSDPDARLALERITHPAIQAEIMRQTGLHADSDRIVVLDIPLLKERRDPMTAIIVVDVPEDIALSRLVGQRGFSEADARARISTQMSRDERRLIADVVIDNSGDEDHLHVEVRRAWQWLTSVGR